MSGEFDSYFGKRGAAQPNSHVDRVSQARREQPSGEPAQEVVLGTTDYHPYGYMPTGAPDCDVQMWNKLRADLPEGAMFDYRYVTMIRYAVVDPEARSMIIELLMPDSIVEIHGVHLDDLRVRLRRRQVSFIQEYSPMVYKIPADRLPAGEPVITAIFVHHYRDGELGSGFKDRTKPN